MAMGKMTKTAKNRREGAIKIYPAIFSLRWFSRAALPGFMVFCMRDPSLRKSPPHFGAGKDSYLYAAAESVIG
jgi:hypothetical protein